MTDMADPRRPDGSSEDPHLLVRPLFWPAWLLRRVVRAGLHCHLVSAVLQGLRRFLLVASSGLALLADVLSVTGGSPLPTLSPSSQQVDVHAPTYRADIVKSSHPESGRPVKIFIDGVFDLTHFGHMNAFRQARAFGDYLIVGVNGDDSVAQSKGMLPVLHDDERQVVVAACRFVDEVMPATPYVMTEEYIDELVREKGVDFFVHGDDPCLVNGRDVYEAAKKAGRFFNIPRTEGISTTDIVGRLLMLTKDHHEASIVERPDGEGGDIAEAGCGTFASKQSRFLVTSQLMKAFSEALPGSNSASSGGRIVYVDGAFDMFHAGHVDLLRRARALGDHLVVGVHSDEVVNANRGLNHPIMAMHERVLGVLGCRFVDDVLLDAPWVITREMVATLHLTVVVRGTVRDCAECIGDWNDPHEVPKALGIHVSLESKLTLSIDEITRRLEMKRQDMSKRQLEKQQKESQWYRQKHGLS